MDTRYFDVLYGREHIHAIFRRANYGDWASLREGMNADFELLVRSQEPYIILNLGEVGQICPGLLGKLVTLGRALQSHGRQLLLCHVRAEASQTLRIPSGPPQRTIFHAYRDVCSFIGCKAA